MTEVTTAATGDGRMSSFTSGYTCYHCLQYVPFNTLHACPTATTDEWHVGASPNALTRQDAPTTGLPTDAASRKTYPVATGVIDYFPDAIAEIGHVSFVGNEQHNPGTPLHWDRSKSGDEADALMRHFLQRGKVDTDGIRHSAKMAWRALALLQKELEAAREGNG